MASRAKFNVYGKRIKRIHPKPHQQLLGCSSRPFATKSPISHNKDNDNNSNGDHWNQDRVVAYVGHSFPDFIEHWNRKLFRRVGYGLTGSTAFVAGFTLSSVDWTTIATVSSSLSGVSLVPAAMLTALTTVYWRVGKNDIEQKHHAVRRNFPFIGNLRYVMETIRPEIRQYVVESDFDGKPFDRMDRSRVYQRAKNVNDTLPFGTRKNLYQVGAEWACHSMWPKVIPTDNDNATRHTIGTKEYGTTQPYSSSVLNISAMSYGAISSNAILALNNGARLGKFSHNTGEGGLSSFHQNGGGDLVWNIGTGYFGCGTTSGTSYHRTFDPYTFQESISEAEGKVKMVEIKLSQGAKPGHGGVLPRSKITPDIAQARKIEYPAQVDCHSPSAHSAFTNAYELVEFIVQLRELSGGLPIGIKMCMGQPKEFAVLCRAMHELGNGPDFVTVDGAEGGTGAAPPEFSDSLGLPLEEGLVLARNMLVGANLRDKTSLIASGRILSGFSIVRALALGANVTNSARGFMLSLGCIQALKCNTNRCPTGIATQDEDLMFGLDPQEKTVRVYNYHLKTVQAAAEIVGSMGYEALQDVTACDIMRRIRTNQVRTLSEHFPEVHPGCLLDGKGPPRLQSAWNSEIFMADTDNNPSTIEYGQWIY